jgi:DNA-binding response OmpR family regulator
MAENIILIVDDDTEIIQDLKDRVTDLGHDVLTAFDKTEAIKVINAISFDLIILEFERHAG